MKVFVISESDIIRDIIGDILKDNEDNIEIISVEKFELIKGIEYDDIDMIIVDIRNDYIRLLDYMQYVKLNYNHVKIIVLDTRKRGKVFKKALKSGAEGYIADIPDRNDFAMIIHNILIGKKYYDLDLLDNLFEHEEKHSRNKLTQREEEVLNLLCEGWNNKEISKKLYITECTVKKHVSNIFIKLNFRSRKDAISYAKLQSK